MRMQLDAAQIHDPGEAGRIVNNKLFSGAAGWEGQGHRSQPGRTLRRRALLIKGLLFGPIYEALENKGAIANSGESARCNGQIIANDIELRYLCPLRIVELSWMGHTNLATLDQ